MNLYDMLQQAQNGNALSEMARQYGLSEDQVNSAVQAMMPAFSTGLKRTTAAPDGMTDFLRALSGGSHKGYFDDATRAFSGSGLQDGNAILGQLFGSKDVSRAVAAQAEAATGIGENILKQMLPSLASMVMGSLSKQSEDTAGSPLGALLEQFTSGFGGAAGAGEGPLDRYEKQQEGSNPFTDMLGQFMSGGAAGGMADNPFGKMFEQFAGKAGQDQGAQDIFGGLFESGRQMSEDYQKNMESIFDQYLGGTDRRR